MEDACDKSEGAWKAAKLGTTIGIIMQTILLLALIIFEIVVACKYSKNPPRAAGSVVVMVQQGQMAGPVMAMGAPAAQ